MTFPTYQITFAGLSTTIRLTKAEAGKLARRARRHGFTNLGSTADGPRVAVRCPLCVGQCEGIVNRFGTLTTSAKALDQAVTEHLTYDCPAVTRPED